jgi:hypothetical protein
MDSTRSLDDRREQAIALRRAGKSRREIKEILGVGSNATLNELLAGEPPLESTRRPNAKDDLHAKARRLRELGYDYNRCEGAKNKPYFRHDRVVFLNSDPGLIMFFLRFLDTAGVGRDNLIYRVQIHESADVAAAEQFWLALTGAAPDQFRKTTLKRHNPKTVRKNVGSNYRGCLRIDVRRSSELYHQIEGWVRAALSVAEAGVTKP